MINNYYDALYKGKNNIAMAKNNNISANEVNVPINTNLGYLEVLVFTSRGQFAVNNASVTVYVQQEGSAVPIFATKTEGFPIIVDLPIAHPVGTLIRGPEYYFTTYDVTVEGSNFAPYRCNNLRLFEGITTKLDVNLLPIIGQNSTFTENIINIPPHPRDVV